MSSIPYARNWGHLGVVSLAQFAELSPITFALQQVYVDQGTGIAKSYWSNGAQWSEIGSGTGIQTLSDGSYGFIDPDGNEYPLIFFAGTPQEGLIANVQTQHLMVDMGADSAHSEILWTFNARQGDSSPDTPDNDLAGARFELPDGNAYVEKTAMTGGVDGGIFPYRILSGYLTQIHFAFRGGSNYTVAAGNTVTASQMVLVSFPNALGCTALEIRAGTSYGPSNRYRDITFTAYSA